MNFSHQKPDTFCPFLLHLINILCPEYVCVWLLSEKFTFNNFGVILLIDRILKATVLVFILLSFIAIKLFESLQTPRLYYNKHNKQTQNKTKHKWHL